jgi:hypothetical protein
VEMCVFSRSGPETTGKRLHRLHKGVCFLRLFGPDCFSGSF